MYVKSFPNPKTISYIDTSLGNSLVVHWLEFQASTARGRDLISGQGTKIPQAAQCGQRGKENRSRRMYTYHTQSGYL